MIKRSFGIYCLICLALGMATGNFWILAIQHDSIGYGISAIIATIACILNILCGIDQK